MPEYRVYKQKQPWFVPANVFSYVLFVKVTIMSDRNLSVVSRFAIFNRIFSRFRIKISGELFKFYGSFPFIFTYYHHHTSVLKWMIVTFSSRARSAVSGIFVSQACLLQVSESQNFIYNIHLFCRRHVFKPSLHGFVILLYGWGLLWAIYFLLYITHFFKIKKVIYTNCFWFPQITVNKYWGNTAY